MKDVVEKYLSLQLSYKLRTDIVVDSGSSCSGYTGCSGCSDSSSCGDGCGG